MQATLTQLSIPFTHHSFSLSESQYSYSIPLQSLYPAYSTDNFRTPSNEQALEAPKASRNPLQSSHSPKQYTDIFHPYHPLEHPLSPQLRSPSAHDSLPSDLAKTVKTPFFSSAISKPQRQSIVAAPRRGYSGLVTMSLKCNRSPPYLPTYVVKA